MGFGQGGGLVAFELKEDLTAVFDDELDVFALAVEGVAGHHRALEVDLSIEAFGGGDLPFGLGGFAFGFLGGDGDRHGRAAFMLA